MGISETGLLLDNAPLQDTSSVLDRSIGEHLRQARRWTDEQVAQVLAYQRERGGRFGEAAVALKLATSDDVLWALSQQFHYPYASADGAQVHAELVVARDPFCDQAEAFRELRSQLMLGVLAAEGPRRALAVVSPDSGDGKSFFAANLAVTLSQLGGSTLLVDADMRTPRQHVLFGAPDRVGLSSILSGRVEASAVHRVPALPGLHVLPVGAVPPNPLELMQRAAFAQLMRELLARFEHVVVDTPAAVHGADSRVIAAACGASLVIGRRGTTRLQALQSLLAALGKGPSRLAGVLINEH